MGGREAVAAVRLSGSKAPSCCKPEVQHLLQAGLPAAPAASESFRPTCLPRDLPRDLPRERQRAPIRSRVALSRVDRTSACPLSFAKSPESFQWPFQTRCQAADAAMLLR